MTASSHVASAAPRMTVTPYASCHLFDTAFGVCAIAWTSTGLTRVQLPERDAAATEQRVRRVAANVAVPAMPSNAFEAVALLQRYLRGEPVDFSALLLDQRDLSAQERAIYEALRAVPSGETTTYGQLAQAIGVPGAARVVGRAMARNPWPVVIPCHRVLTAARTSGGFSAYGGAATQRRLLRLEGVTLPAVSDPLPDLFD